MIRTIGKHITLWLTVCMGLCAISAPVLGVVQNQELKTLKLIKTYQSEAEVRAASPDLSSKKAIRDEGESINFYDPQTNQLLKQMKKEQPTILREEKQGEYTTVMEKTYEYKIATHHSLVMYTEYEGGYIKETQANPPPLYPEPQKRILYNRKGEVITELPLSLNYVEDSPDHNYFVATYDGEGGGADFIYFYDMKGSLLKKQPMNAYIGFRYSSNSEYVKVQVTNPSKAFGEIFLFTKTGELLGKYNYGEQLRDNLFDVHISEHAEWLLFSMFNSSYLLSMDGRIIWQKPYVRVIDCRFHPEKNRLLLYVPIDKRMLIESRKAVQIISFTDGELLDSIEDVELLQLTQNGFLVKKGELYYEYTIR